MRLAVKGLIIVAAGCLVVPSIQTKAATIGLNINDSQALGYVSPGVDFGDSDIPGYINTLVGMNPNTTLGPIQYAGHANTWVRFAYNPSPLDTVTSADEGTSSGGKVTSFDIGAGAEYLLGKYDGPQGGLEIWYVGNLVGDTVTIPANGDPNGGGGNYGLSGSWLFSPGGGGSVPDGASTLLLLGGAISGLGLIRRKLMA